VGETKVTFLEEQYSKNNAIKSKNLILGLQARDKAAMLLVNTIIYFRWIYTKMELVPIGEKYQPEMHLFMFTNMAAMSRANQQLGFSANHILLP